LHAATDPFVIVSQNAQRLFDHIDDGNKETVVSMSTYRSKLATLAAHIRASDRSPAIIALQEVENRRVLQDLASHLGGSGYSYREILIEGNDVSGIDVGFLLRDDVQLEKVQALFANHRLQPDRGPLFTRPPLMIEVCRDQCLTLVNLHLRSMRGLRHQKKGQRVAHKRKQQAETLARWIDNWQQRNRDQPLLVIGDFNALPRSDSYVDVTGTLRGSPDQQRPRYKTFDLIKADLIDLALRIPPARRYSYRYRGKRQQLDHALGNRLLYRILTAIRFDAINYRASDHAALVLQLDFD
jgi:predicted extracellular nuclease